ncbi:hypothetical protein [Plantibacter sp. YIM 135347]
MRAECTLTHATGQWAIVDGWRADWSPFASSAGVASLRGAIAAERDYR